jgi:hypothetical protein
MGDEADCLVIRVAIFLSMVGRVEWIWDRSGSMKKICVPQLRFLPEIVFVCILSCERNIVFF